MFCFIVEVQFLLG